MTTDDQKLTEQIAQKLHEVDPISGHDPRWDRLLKMDREWYRIKAAAVLPIIAAEVQAAKAEALRETVEKYAITIPDALGYKVPAVTVEDLTDAADEYETGDQA